MILIQFRPIKDFEQSSAEEKTILKKKLKKSMTSDSKIFFVMGKLIKKLED